MSATLRDRRNGPGRNDSHDVLGSCHRERRSGPIGRAREPRRGRHCPRAMSPSTSIFHTELQGRAGHHRQVPGRAEVSDGARHRPRRRRSPRAPTPTGRPATASSSTAGASAKRHWGGFASGAPQGRLAGAAARRVHRPPGDGDRHRRLHRRPLRRRAAELRRRRPTRARSWSPARPAGSAASRSPC